MQFHDLQPSEPASRGRLAVVSGFANDPLTPRGQRTRQLVERLRDDWELELIALPAETFEAKGGRTGPGRAPWRQAAGKAVRALLLDKWELWSALQFARWEPAVDAALLIAYPWSPAVYAARRLRRARIPYVLDAGDPWGLTAPVPIGGRLTRGRWRRAERSVWSNASGAVVTTEQQADVLTGMFPSLPVLVRPNGFELPPGVGERNGGPTEPTSRRLRLVHYGTLPALRVDVNRLLETLVASGRWESVQLTQFGEDPKGMLRQTPSEVEIEWRAPRPWSEVLEGAREFDVAVVIGNVLPGQLPSKAVQYMTLPIPRLALTDRAEGDALSEYVRGRPGWAAVEWDDPDADRVVWEHLSRGWSDAALDPPPEEAWPAVSAQIAEFVAGCVARSGDRHAVPYTQTAPQGA